MLAVNVWDVLQDLPAPLFLPETQMPPKLQHGSWQQYATQPGPSMQAEGWAVSAVLQNKLLRWLCSLSARTKSCLSACKQELQYIARRVISSASGLPLTFDP